MLDENSLLAPVSEAFPVGDDLSFSAEFDRIIEYRRADDPTLDQGAWQTDIKSADWANVRHDCEALLRQRTKDLRLAGWLVESYTQLDGFHGLAAGLRVTSGLCERYWPELHPMAAPGDNEERIGNLAWLLGNALQWVRNLPITAAPQGRFSLSDLERAHSRPPAESADGVQGPALAVLAAARQDTSHDFYRALLASLAECRDALIRLQHVIDTQLGNEGPSFSPLQDQLETLTRTVQRFARESGLLLEESPTLDSGSDGIAMESPLPLALSPSITPSSTSAPSPGTRREALQQLRSVAAFFRRTEPHSPVAYLADKAAHWGEMPLHVWLAQVIKDDGTLAQMHELLDIDSTQAS